MFSRKAGRTSVSSWKTEATTSIETPARSHQRLRSRSTKAEWNQGSAGGLDLQSELPGQIVTKRSGTDFCNGQASGRDYQPGHAETGVFGLDDELVFIRNISIRNLSIRNFSLKNAGHFGVAPDLYSGIAAFLLQHCGDVARRTIAE